MSDFIERYNALKKEMTAAKEALIRLESKKESLKSSLDALKNDVKEKYGVDDLDALVDLIKTKQADQARIESEIDTSLSKFESLVEEQK